MFKPALAVLLAVLGPAIPARGQEVQPVPLEFLSEGARVRGKFFAAAGAAPAHTLVLVPGWPGNPNDVLGLGALLSGQGLNVMMFNPPGLHESEGTASFGGTLRSIGAALRWLQQPDVQKRFGVDAASVALGECIGRHVPGVSRRPQLRSRPWAIGVRYSRLAAQNEAALRMSLREPGIGRDQLWPSV